jgi:hypothetical protein
MRDPFPFLLLRSAATLPRNIIIRVQQCRCHYLARCDYSKPTVPLNYRGQFVPARHSTLHYVRLTVGELRHPKSNLFVRACNYRQVTVSPALIISQSCALRDQFRERYLKRSKGWLAPPS